MKPGERLGVVDLGSNSFRLVVFMAGDGWWRRTDEIYEPVRIGEGLAATGELGELPVSRALATLEVFAHFCRASGLDEAHVDAVATSAIREARNAEAFLAPARECFPGEIRVLSREQEAYYAYLAAVNSTTLEQGCVLDLGGGSMQLLRVEDRLPRQCGSWRVGTVLMSERYLPANGPAKRKQLDELRGHVAEELSEARWLESLGQGSGRLIGLGGTVRNLAAAAQRAAGLPSIGVQGMVVERGALRGADRKAGGAARARAGQRPRHQAGAGGPDPGRGDRRRTGCCEAGGFESLEVTEAGLREGVFFERLLGGTPGGSGRPPMFEDVRRRSVLNLARQYTVDAAHTEHVASLALGMFDKLAALGLHDGDARERELLWAACMLHDIGMSIDYDDHHKHSRYLILNGGLPGFAPVETAIIAQSARYHRKGMPSPGPMAPLFGPGDAERLDRCATLLRLAEDLERSRDQLVRRALLEESDGTVELRLVADGDSAVPSWAARREGELFERAFRRELRVAA